MNQTTVKDLIKTAITESLQPGGDIHTLVKDQLTAAVAPGGILATPFQSLTEKLSKVTEDCLFPCRAVLSVAVPSGFSLAHCVFFVDSLPPSYRKIRCSFFGLVFLDFGSRLPSAVAGKFQYSSLGNVSVC